MMEVAPSERPFISIVVTGRNDDFGGDFNGRFFRALRFNHEQLTRAQVSHEFVFVEWRPIERRPYLATLLDHEFPELAASSLRSVVVDPQYHEALSLNPRLQFQEFIAKNVGIRRARGEFVLSTNTDIYLSRRVVARLAEGRLERAVLYRAPRHDLKDHVDGARMNWDVLEDERNCEIVNAIQPPYFTNASGDFLLIDRESCLRLRGFNEIYRSAKIHIDGNFCVKAADVGLRLVDVGSPVYHVGRGTLHAHVNSYRNRQDEAPWGDMRWNSQMLYDNPPTWGLGSAPERPINRSMTYLDFDWNAVGPMVELHRVVMPSIQRRDTV